MRFVKKESLLVQVYFIYEKTTDLYRKTDRQTQEVKPIDHFFLTLHSTVCLFISSSELYLLICLCRGHALQYVYA